MIARIRTRSVATLVAMAVSAGCSEVPGPIAIDAMGGLDVLMYLDLDGNGAFTEAMDVPASGAEIVLESSARKAVEAATVSPAGVSRFGPLPVGRYRVVVAAATLGDSLTFSADETPWIEVLAGDTTAATVGVGYPVVTAADLANAPVGRIVAVKGIALNATRLFSDSLVHVAMDGGVVRAAVRNGSGGLATGDSARVLGRVGVLLGRKALLAASAYSLGNGEPPSPPEVSASAAASANGGATDGALVRITDARVISVTNIPAGGRRVRVSDSTGVLDVIIDRSVDVATADPLIPGATVSATGVLVPVADGGIWSLRPRGSTDVSVSIPTVSVSAARAMPVGSAVAITGVALNGAANFGDASLHVADASASIRALALSTNLIFPGNSVRVAGVLAMVNGQPVISPATVTVLGSATVPSPILLTTAAAATASAGALDAALVELRDVRVDSINSIGSTAIVVADDGSGPVSVRIDADTGILPGAGWVGRRANLVGLLVPVGAGSWVLKPRVPLDVTIF